MAPGRWALLAGLLVSLAASAAPGRHLRYAESHNRLVYAFVFGSRDTCRVIARSAPPRWDLAAFLRRPPGPDYRGEAGDKVVAEFQFGRRGRPVHIVPTNDARHLIAFANRAPDGSPPRQDTLHFLEEKGYAERLDYEALPDEALPPWPDLPRALAPRKAKAPPPEPATYAFVTREEGAGRLLVARRTEWDDGAVTGEMACFLVAVPEGKVRLPAEGELLALIDDAEPLYRAGAAWALGHLGKPAFAGPIRQALGRAQTGAERAECARALVRCGDGTARRTLRALLADEADVGGRRAAAFALAQLEPEKADADALAAAVSDEDRATRDAALLALARLDGAAANALVKASRSSQPARRAACARALGLLTAEAAERRLLILARDPKVSVQSAAARALTAPPRAIFPEHHREFARALEACRKSRNVKAAYRLATLAAHARIHHEKVLKALVDLAPVEKRAIWALARLTGEKLESAGDCREWWKRRD